MSDRYVQRAYMVTERKTAYRVLIQGNLIFFPGWGWTHVHHDRLVTLPRPTPLEDGFTWAYGYKHPKGWT